MKSLARICLNLILALQVLASLDSNTVWSQERPAFEIDTELGAVTQASMEVIVDEPMQPAPAPKIIFLPAEPASMGQEIEGYEIRFESIEGSDQKRIKLSVPTSVIEIEISHGTKTRVEETASKIKLKSASPNDRAEVLAVHERSEPEFLIPPSGIPFLGKHQLLPTQGHVAGPIKNPYFYDRGAEETGKPESSKVLQRYASTPYHKINESLSDGPTISEPKSERMAEKQSQPVQARLTDMNDMK